MTQAEISMVERRIERVSECPRRFPRGGRLLGAGAAALMLGVIACSADAPIPCGQIPEGGCPVGRGGTCADHTCTGLYDCIGGKWRETTVCMQGQGGSGSSGSATTSSSGPCTGTMLDHTNETTGCMPDLESPDCVSDVAETCHPCASGCIDFFMCKAQGWVNVAFCDTSGNLILKNGP